MSCKGVLKSKNNSYTNTKHDSFNFISITGIFQPPKHWTENATTKTILWNPRKMFQGKKYKCNLVILLLLTYIYAVCRKLLFYSLLFFI